MEIVIPESSLGTFAICPEHRLRLEKIILHEAGHYVIARRFGFQACHIKICWMYQGGQYDCCVGNDTARRLSNHAAIELFLEDRILTLLAGAMAESLNDGKVDTEAAADVLMIGGGKNDDGKISELIHLLRNIRYADLADDAAFKEAASAITDELWNKARTLVEAEHEVISAFAQELDSKVERGGEEYIFSEEDLQALLSGVCEDGKGTAEGVRSKH